MLELSATILCEVTQRETLVAQAHQAIYRAKDLGRDGASRALPTGGCEVL